MHQQPYHAFPKLQPQCYRQYKWWQKLNPVFSFLWFLSQTHQQWFLQLYRCPTIKFIKLVWYSYQKQENQLITKSCQCIFDLLSHGLGCRWHMHQLYFFSCYKLECLRYSDLRLKRISSVVFLTFLQTQAFSRSVSCFTMELCSW